MQPTTKTSTLLGLLIVLTIIAGLLLALSNIAKQQRILSISSFEECARAGYPIMESYPEQCRTPDGRTFINPEQEVTHIPDVQGGAMVANGCAVAGCSGTICVSQEEASDIFTTCEFRPEYACYRDAVCEPQADGKCGWTETEELLRCLDNPPPIEGQM